MRARAFNRILEMMLQFSSLNALLVLPILRLVLYINR